MVGDGPVRSLLIASEPLTVDVSTWLEVPEYSMITAQRTADGARATRRWTWMSDPTGVGFLAAAPLFEGLRGGGLADVARVMRRRSCRSATSCGTREPRPRAWR